MKGDWVARANGVPGSKLISVQRGVTSIEYALIAALIAIAIVGGVSAAGGANGESWTAWTGAAIAVFQSVLGP